MKTFEIGGRCNGKTIKKMIKLFEKMGYDVANNERYGYVQISLRTKDRFISLTVTYRELVCCDFIVGDVVRKMNEAIKA